MKQGTFPAPENNTYKISEEEKEKMMELLEKVEKAAGIKVESDSDETTKLYWTVCLEMSLSLEQLLSFYYKDTCFLGDSMIQLDKDASVVNPEQYVFIVGGGRANCKKDFYIAKCS